MNILGKDKCNSFAGWTGGRQVGAQKEAGGGWKERVLGKITETGASGAR